MVIAGVSGLMAQTPMPLNPDVKHGVLPNGLSYYIQHNEEPKGRANFYIAQKVGSTLETSEQLGLAHFLEHMAFNGTTNFPGKNMLNYLMSKGIRFGADINAYTSFDETVYNVNNVPTADKALMDSVLLVLHDWSSEILLETDEIDAERGVIEEEWRSRNTAQQRTYEAVLPKIYKEYNYQQMPIGKIEIVRSFDPEVLRAYYKKWYRPDQQGIVIVGDFDAAEMEKKVVDMFSPIPMPENAAERVYPTVSDNDKPIYAYYEDPETRFPRADVSFKYEKIPFEMRNTMEGYMQDVAENLISMLLNNRLDEYSNNPECDYASAGVYFGNFWVSKTKGAFNLIVLGKNEIQNALNDAAAIVARACKTGFTDSELSRVRDQFLANLEKAYNERNKMDNDDLASELIRHFVDNEPSPGVETEYNMMKQLLPMIPIQALNQAASQLLTPDNQVLVISMPQKEGMAVVTEEGIVGSFEKTLNDEYEAYVDEVITEPLIAQLPKAGAIKSENKGAFEATEFILSNGVKVLVKPTDFKSDEIIFQAFRHGGKQSFDKSLASNVKVSGLVSGTAKNGPFDLTTMQKYLAGKRATVGFEIGNFYDLVEGSSTVKDLPTLMELIYSTFTQLTPDEKTYEAQIAQIRAIIGNDDKNPSKVFSKNIAKSRYNNNPMMMPLDVADLDADYMTTFNMVKKAFENAADYTFVFVGNIDINTFKPLMEQYIATLPANAKKARKAADVVTPIKQAQGDVLNDFTLQMQAPATNVYALMSDTNIPYSPINDTMLSLTGELLSNIYTDTLREEEGGTYSPQAGGAFNPMTGEWNLIYVFITNADMKDKLVARADDELHKLLNDGADAASFNKVKEAAVNQFDIETRDNNYWISVLRLNERGIDSFTGLQESLNGLTLDQLNNFMKTLNTGKNHVKVIMNGVAE